MHLVHDALHAAQLLVHLGSDVLAAHHAGRSLGQPQGPMHRRPALGGIHRVTAKQSVDPVGQVLLTRQREQSVERLLGQALLGVIEQQRPAISVQALEALRIIGEELRQMGVLDVIGMLSQDPPHITYSPEMDRHTAKTKTAREPVGAPAPGANGACPRRQSVPASFAVRTGAVRRSGGAPTAKTKTACEPVGAPAPCANGGLPGRKYVPASFAVRTGGGAPTTKPQPAPNP